MTAFHNKSVLVLGGSRGIGAAIVRRFVADGASVLFSYSGSPEAAERLAAETGSMAVQADIRNTVTVVVILSELLRRVEQLGLIHLWVKILHARLQNEFVHPVRRLVCYLVLASPEHRRLFFITNLFCRLPRGRQRFGIRGALIEGRFQHRASGIAVDAPGGDPGHLLSNDGFQTAAGGRWFVVRGCFGIERFRRGLAQGEFTPGVEA
nr:SDR family NAD(P)-dependent oxidoreductase [Klebsiella variicola]